MPAKTPAIPPIKLPTIEVSEKKESPHKAGIYPPIVEPIIKPAVIKNLGDISLLIAGEIDLWGLPQAG